jgi:hypothetical protein
MHRKAHATQLYNAFVSDTRTNGATFYKLADDAPEWMHDAVHAAHDAVDELPDDEVYAACRSAAEALADSDNWEDGAHEWADGEVSVYNATRVAWLAEKPLIRGPLVDEAAQEMGFSYDGDSAGIFALIAYGWYEWARRIYGAIADACEAQADEGDDSDSDDE